MATLSHPVFKTQSRRPSAEARTLSVFLAAFSGAAASNRCSAPRATRNADLDWRSLMRISAAILYGRLRLAMVWRLSYVDLLRADVHLPHAPNIQTRCRPLPRIAQGA